MCGIAGVVLPAGAGPLDVAAAERQVDVMLDSLAHRGPDGGGVVVVGPEVTGLGPAVLGVRRLAVVGGAAAALPVVEPSGGVLVGNGELYDHRTERDRLTAAGIALTSGSDLAVALPIVAGGATGELLDLRGMFALAVAAGGRVVLARDPVGMKPLRIAAHPSGGLAFASEAKALLAAGIVRLAFDPGSVVDALGVGQPVGVGTGFSGITHLAPGHVMVMEATESGLVAEVVATRPVPRSDFDSRTDRGREAQETELLGAVLDDTVAQHLVADDPVALLLSGGIDSGLLAATAVGLGERPTAFTVSDHDEAADVARAAALARALGLEHRMVHCSFDRWLAALPGHLWATEQWHSLTGVVASVLYQRVATETRAVLTGDGADEVFCGYDHLGDPAALTAAAARSRDTLAEGGWVLGPSATACLDELATPGSSKESLARWHAFHLGDQLVHNHLLPIDAASMAKGLEVRLPYLDREVLSTAASLPHATLAGPPQKGALRRLALERHPELLDDAVAARKVGMPAAGGRCLERFADLCAEVLPTTHRGSVAALDLITAPHRRFARRLFEWLFEQRVGARVDEVDVLDVLAAEAGVPVRRVRHLAEA